MTKLTRLKCLGLGLYLCGNNVHSMYFGIFVTLQLGYATLLQPSQISVEELLMTLFSCNILCRSPTEGIWEVYFNKLSSQATHIKRAWWHKKKAYNMSNVK